MATELTIQNTYVNTTDESRKHAFLLRLAQYISAQEQKKLI